jgi:L-2-hydroxyglutarate oxidase LhgO
MSSGTHEHSYDLAVIGAGIVGLATARAALLARPSSRVVILEKESEVARHQSGRNSGVVHAGLYYPSGSLKAQLCREGRVELLAFADRHAIPYTTCGKLVVALDEGELPRLHELARRGEANGLIGLRMLDAAQARQIEPHAAGVQALHVPETAVIDFARVTRALAAEVEQMGARIEFGRTVDGIETHHGLRRLRTREGEVIETRQVVGCAGVQADRVAALSGVHPSAYRIAPFRGDFYDLAEEARPLVRALIYPVPDPAFPFLGVHFTRRIEGEVWAGPNAVPALSREGYRRLALSGRDARDLLTSPGLWRLGRRYWRTGVSEIWRDAVKRSAVAQMRRYLPELEPAQVSIGHCGIRAQVLGRDGVLVDDFLLERGDAPAVVHVLNAPSPAATASLAIGRRIAAELAGA